MIKKILCTIVLLVTLSAYAYDFKADGIYYNILDVKNKTVEVTLESDNSYSGDIVVPFTVSYQSSLYTVTTIGSNAFHGCINLGKVTLPESIINIGDFAFEQSGLNEVNLPESITKISRAAFSGCNNLTQIRINKNIKTIEGNAFRGCNNLNQVVYTATAIENYGTYFNPVFPSTLKSIIVEENVEHIPDYFICNCQNITEINIPNSVKSIGDGAFEDCVGLVNVELPNSVNTIGVLSFGNCSNLNSISLGDSLMEIKDEAFSGCGKLISIYFPSSLERVGKWAFLDCSSLRFVQVDDYSTWCKIDFGNETANPYYLTKRLIVNGSQFNDFGRVPDGVDKMGDYALYGCDAVTEIVLPNSINSIGTFAFANCSELKSANLGTKINSIGDYAFTNCTKLSTVSFGNELSGIGDYTFYKCWRIKEITLPSTLKRVGDYAFYDCIDLQCVNCFASVPPTIFVNSFCNYKTASLHIPNDKYVDYMSESYWYLFNTVADDLDNQMDGIETIKVDSLPSNIIIYSMDGTPHHIKDSSDFNHLMSGIYIIKGRKYRIL